MAENIITNANDVQVIISSADQSRDTSPDGDMGRMVVDEFSITREEDVTLESGIGTRTSVGLSNGDIEHTFSFTLTGDDVDVFEMVADDAGRSKLFDFTARKLGTVDQEDTAIEWEYALTTCKATTEELSASTGDPIEYSVDGVAVDVDKASVRAWNDEDA